MLAKSLPVAGRSRLFHTSLPTSVLQQKHLPVPENKHPKPTRLLQERDTNDLAAQAKQEATAQDGALGVYL